MLKPTTLQFRRFWLLLATVVSVAIVGSVMWQANGELGAARKRQAEFTESFVPSVYQLEREYLRFSHQVDLAARGARPADLEALGFALGPALQPCRCGG